MASLACNTLICVLCHLLVNLLGMAGGAELTYVIAEELPAGTFVGSLSEDTGLPQSMSADSLQDLRYSFLVSDAAVTELFRLDENSGELFTGGARLDREVLCPYAEHCVLPLQVAIQSTLHPFFKVVFVDINVTDINDNAPTFPSDRHVIVSEKASIPSTFPLPSAEDLDMGAGNGVMEYELSAAGGPFGLSFTSGSPNLLLVVERELDRERQDRYHLQVIARDGGIPARTGTMLVIVTVRDENDNEPQFTEQAYDVTVDEDVAGGHVLLELTATDHDSGDYGRVRYRLSPKTSEDVLALFAMDPDSGQLTVVGDLEGRDKEVYHIVVEASDLGWPPFTTSTTVTVTVRDVIYSPLRLPVSNLSGGREYDPSSVDPCTHGMELFDAFATCARPPRVFGESQAPQDGVVLTKDAAQQYLDYYCATLMPQARTCFAERTNGCGSHRSSLDELAEHSGLLCEPGTTHVNTALQNVVSKLTDEDLGEDNSNEATCNGNDIKEMCTMTAMNSIGISYDDQTKLHVANITVFLPLMQTFTTNLFECYISQFAEAYSEVCSNWRGILLHQLTRPRDNLLKPYLLGLTLTQVDLEGLFRVNN